MWRLPTPWAPAMVRNEKWRGVQREKWSVCSLPKSTKVFRLYAGSLTTWDRTVEHTVQFLETLPKIQTSSYVTRSSWSNTALCLARYLSFSCFFFLPKMEQLICSFFDFSIAWQAILHSYVADVLITLMQQIFLWWESFLSNYWALSASSFIPGAPGWESGQPCRRPPPSWPATSCGHPCWWSAGCPRCWRGCRPGRRGSGHRPSGRTRTGPARICRMAAAPTGTREQSAEKIFSMKFKTDFYDPPWMWHCPGPPWAASASSQLTGWQHLSR